MKIHVRQVNYNRYRIEDLEAIRWLGSRIRISGMFHWNGMVEWNIGMTFSKFDFEGVGNGEGREGGGQTHGYGGKEMPTSKEAPEDQEKEWMKRSLATRFSPSPNHKKKQK